MPRETSLVDDLITLPWWVSLVLAAIVYVVLKFWIPTIQFSNPVFNGLAGAAPGIAGLFAIILIGIALISAFHSWSKGKLLESQTSVKSIKDLSWIEFEHLVSEAYRREGYSVIENLSGGADGGVDLVLIKDVEKILVQCKNWRSSKVGVSVVREMLGLVTAEKASKGVVVCSGAFTNDAIRFARKNGIQLVGGSELTRMISAVQKLQKVTVQKSSNDCPKCGSHMVLRTAKKGKNAGSSFWGCSRFPGCRGTRST